MEWKEWSTLIFAGTSTIFAGLTFLYAYKTFARDNYSLKFHISRMTSVQDRKDILKLDVTNVGRHRVSIAGIMFNGIEKNRVHFILEGDDIPRFKTGNYPYEIGFGENFTIIFDLELLVKDFGKESKNSISGFIIEDSLFKKYEIKIDFSMFPELKKDQN